MTTNNPMLLGIHHVTAISRSPQRTIDFYTQLLGLRLIKLTVNYDDPSTYHFYFGNNIGQPGTILTFFPWPEAPKGEHGTGQVSTISFNVPMGSLDYWTDRFKSSNISYGKILDRFNEQVLPFQDIDGQNLELIANHNDIGSSSWKNSPVPSKYHIYGFHSVTLHEQNLEDTESMLVDVMGLKLARNEKDRYRYRIGTGNFANIVDVVAVPHGHRGLVSVGTVHHVAFRVVNDQDQLVFRDKIREVNPAITPVINRNYFHSIYYREPGGVLFEIATDLPGFMIDESLEKLGTGLMLPSWIEQQREEIVEMLPKVQVSTSMTTTTTTAAT